MGLDQFAFKVKVKLSKEVDFGSEIYNPETGDDLVEREELHYWRKHPNLHGWMEHLYRQKGGDGRDFNGDPVVLTKEDLDNLASSIIDEELPDTEGFFFGQSYNNEEERQDDLDFVKKAHRAIEEGYTVYYDSWW